MSTDLNERPRPVLAAAKSVSSVVATLGGLVAALAGWGVITAAQGDAVVGLLGLVPGLFTAGASLLAAFGVVRRSETEVTPLVDPQDDDGTPLVRAS